MYKKGAMRKLEARLIVKKKIEEGLVQCFLTVFKLHRFPYQKSLKILLKFRETKKGLKNPKNTALVKKVNYKKFKCIENMCTKQYRFF